MQFGHACSKRDLNIINTNLETKVSALLVPSETILSTTVIQNDKISGPCE